MKFRFEGWSEWDDPAYLENETKKNKSEEKCKGAIETNMLQATIQVFIKKFYPKSTQYKIDSLKCSTNNMHWNEFENSQ